jgi:flagellar biogenesis protein FliO
VIGVGYKDKGINKWVTMGEIRRIIYMLLIILSSLSFSRYNIVFAYGGSEDTALSIGGSIKVFFTIVGVMLLAYAATRFLGAYMSPRGKGRILQVLETCVLGKGRAIHLIKVGERVLLVGSGEEGITPIIELSHDEAGGLLNGIEKEGSGRRKE